MKRFAHLILIAFLTATSCSKKGGPELDSIVIGSTKYLTVKVGTQTWTAVNYNGPGGVNYGGSNTNDPTYGKLYTHAEAAAVVLPAGWHVPSMDDYNQLFISAGGIAINQTTEESPQVTVTLMSKATWSLDGGTDITGWNATAGGLYVEADPPSYFDKGNRATFLTSSYLPNNVRAANVYFNGGGSDSTIGVGGFASDDTGRGSVRFVKDN